MRTLSRIHEGRDPRVLGLLLVSGGVEACGGLDDDLEQVAQLSDDVAFTRDEDPPEEGLVVLAPQGVRRSSVRLLAAGQQLECPVEIGFERFESHLQAAEAFEDGCQRLRDALLFFAVELSRDGAVQVSLEEFADSGIEPGLLADELHLRLACLFRSSLELASQMASHERPSVLVELEMPVELDDFALDGRDREGALFAAVSLCVASAADEVVADHTMPVLRMLNEEAVLALTADERALEVHVVDTHLLANHSCGHEVLNSLPGDWVDDGLVSTGIDDTLKPDLTFVVRVGEDLMQHGHRDCAARSRRRRR